MADFPHPLAGRFDWTFWFHQEGRYFWQFGLGRVIDFDLKDHQAIAYQKGWRQYGRAMGWADPPRHEVAWMEMQAAAHREAMARGMRITLIPAEG